MAVTAAREPWSALLDAGRADQRLVREAFEGARAPDVAPIPAGLHPRLRRRPGARGHHAGCGPTRQQALLSAHGADDDRHDGHRVGQVAVLQPAGAAGPAPAPDGPRAVPLPDQGAGPGPGPRAQRARHGQGDPPGDLRRGHAPGGPPRRSAAGPTSILTNPDMLHVGILPNHDRHWADFFHNLDVVVVDEAHVYRGVFGSHVANVLRRLRRVLRPRAADPAGQRDDRQPGRAGRAPDGAGRRRRRSTATARPGARRQIAMWNPPVTDEALQTRRSRAGRGGRAGGRARARGRADDLLHEVPQGRGADGQDGQATTSSSPRRPSWPTAWRPTAPATRRSSGASSSAG